MLQYTTLTCFVTSRRNFSEADRIITVFSRERGKTQLVAKGVRRPKAKLASSLEPFFEINLRSVQSKKMPIIIGAQPIRALPPAAGSYEALLCGHTLLELTELSHDDEQVNQSWYELCLQLFAMLTKIDPEPGYYALIQAAALVASLKILGLTVTLPTNPHQTFFNIAEASFSRLDRGIPVSISALKLWRFLANASPSDIAKLRQASASALELAPLLERFWHYHTGLTLKSKALA